MKTLLGGHSAGTLDWALACSISVMMSHFKHHWKNSPTSGIQGVAVRDRRFVGDQLDHTTNIDIELDDDLFLQLIDGMN